MASNPVASTSSPWRQRVLLLIAALAMVSAWRERSFAKNRARHGSPL